MGRFIEEAVNAIQSTACAVLSANEFINGGIGRLPGVDVSSYNDAINATRRQIGCDPANDPVLPPPDFNGGQCDQVLYNVQLSGQNFGNPQSFSVQRVGPIGGVCFIDNGAGVNRGLGLISADGGVTMCRAVGQNLLPEDEGTWSITGISRVGGAPDDCGDPPPTFPPPTDFDIDVDITYQPDFGVEVTVPVTINYNPFEVNIDGSLRIPFNFDFGGFTFDGSLSFNPDVVVNINPPRVRPPTINPDNTEPGPPEDERPEVDPEDKIIGVVVISEIINDDKISSYSSPQIPDIFVPRLGSVKFAYSFGVSTFWSSDIDIKGDRTFIECPFSRGADAVVASPQLGVNMTAIPIRGFALATVDDVLKA